MRATYIRIYKFKRVHQSLHAPFEHHFQKKLTMLVGQNGAGKSSLIGQITPLPADKSDYERGGYREIHFEHKGNTYKLIDDFTEGSAKFYFYCNDENLNLSCNVSTQRELALQHFGITPIVQDLLTGAESFTQMSLINRKKLFNAITHLNIEAILENYNDLKDKLKNQEFLLKNVTSLLMTEKQKLSDESRVQELQNQKASCKQMLEALLDFRMNLHRYVESGSVEQAHAYLNEQQTAYKSLYQNAYAYVTSRSQESLQPLKEKALAQISHANAVLQQLYNRIEEVDQQLDAVRLLQKQDAQNLQAQQVSLTQERANTLASLRYLSLENFTEQTLSQVLVLEHSIPDVVHHLPANPDKRLGKHTYMELTQQRADYVVELNKLLQQEINDKQLLQELEGHANYRCPNCAHTWLPEEVQTKLQQVSKSLAAIQSQKESYQLKLQALIEPIKEQEAYLEIYTQLTNIFNSTKHTLKEFWSAVLDSDVIYTDPPKIAIMLRQLQMDAQGCARILEIDATLKEINAKLDVVSAVGNKSVQDLEDIRMKFEEEIESQQIHIEAQQAQIRDLEITRSYYDRLHRIGSMLERAKQLVYTQHLSYTVKSLLDETDSELSKLKVQMIEIDKELTSQQFVEKMIQGYEEQIASIQEDVKVLKILTDELSPKNGFIAKCVSNFLNVIINSMNTVISGVWDYKMQIKAINVEEDVLNYKFRVSVEDRLDIEDISKVSSGMQEIINLAMKVTLFKLLKLEDYPMYLDEFGVRLDSVHRARVADLIFKMIGSSTYSQIFLITHLDLSYGDFKETETIELTAA